MSNDRNGELAEQLAKHNSFSTSQASGAKKRLGKKSASSHMRKRRKLLVGDLAK